MHKGRVGRRLRFQQRFQQLSRAGDPQSNPSPCEPAQTRLDQKLTLTAAVALGRPEDDVSDTCLLHPGFKNSLLMSAAEAYKRVFDENGPWPQSMTHRYDKLIQVTWMPVTC